MLVTWCRHNWLFRWPLVIELNLQLLSSPWSRDDDGNPLITGPVLLATSLILRESCLQHKHRYGQKALIMNNNRCPSDPYHWGNSKGFRNSVPGTGNKDQIDIYSCVTISHSFFLFLCKVSGTWNLFLLLGTLPSVFCTPEWSEMPSQDNPSKQSQYRLWYHSSSFIQNINRHQK